MLAGLSLEVGAGEFIAVVGPNGHGKTTFLKTVSGLVRTRAGRIWFAGADIARLRADRIDSPPALCTLRKATCCFPT